ALDRERRKGVRPDVLAPILPPGRELPHALTTVHGEESDEVVHVVPEVIGEAEALTVRLTGELEARELPSRGVEDDHRVAGRARGRSGVATGRATSPPAGIPAVRAACSARTRSTRRSRVTAEKRWFARSSPSIASFA